MAPQSREIGLFSRIELLQYDSQEDVEYALAWLRDLEEACASGRVETTHVSSPAEKQPSPPAAALPTSRQEVSPTSEPAGVTPKLTGGIGIRAELRRASDDEIQRLLDNPLEIRSFLSAGRELASEDVVDLEKAWRGIHLLLTGDEYGGAPPLDFLLFGATPIGNADIGYSSAKAYRSGDVRVIADALEGISSESFRIRFDPDDMDIGPDDDSALDYLTEYFVALRTFLFDTAERHSGMILNVD